MNKLTLLLLDRVAAWLCGRDLWAAAQSLVALYEDKTMPPYEKRARVFVALRDELQTLGLEVVETLINFAIEAALVYLRRRASP